MEYKDLGDVSEDQRIEEIGREVMHSKKSVAFIVDDEPDKPERYIRKLQERFPGIVVIGRGNGPVKDTIWVKVGPAAKPTNIIN